MLNVFESVNPWVDLVNYFRNVPVDEKTRDFTAQAEALYNHKNFNPSAQRIFRAAVERDPTQFSHRSLRRYLNCYNDLDMAAIYWKRYDSITPTSDPLESIDERVWSIRCALSMAAVDLDIARTGKDQSNAKDAMRDFCKEVLSKFPGLPEQMKVLLYKVRNSGILTEKPLRFQTTFSAALEKGDQRIARAS
jgi:hypothetical protein